jgi:isopentenyl-diphosphate delta-isomerase
MSEVAPINSRKSDHIRINLSEDVDSGLSTGLNKFRFIHRALPEIDLDQVDLSVSIFGKYLKAPILISSMTGGTQEALAINRTLAAAAEATGIAIGLGSQRAAIENPELVDTYRIRMVAPKCLLFANLGAIQLNYSYGINQCLRAVEMIEADALILHFNALQEAVQSGGDTHFSGLAKKIAVICRSLPVPVIAKEVGWGFSKPDIQLLEDCGISAIDVAGAGGTSWSQVEMYRATDENQAQLAAAFLDWGIPTAEAITNVRSISPHMLIFASGGLRNGVDIAKCIALGASLGGLARPFLKTAAISLEKTIQTIQIIQRQIQVCMFCSGASNLGDLQVDRVSLK